MNPENPLYSVSLGVASLQVDSVGIATALSPVCVGHFKFYLSTSIVSLGLIAGKRSLLALKVIHHPKAGSTNVVMDFLPACWFEPQK